MHHVRISGTYDEMGRQQGRTLRRVGLTFPPAREKVLRFAKQCQKIADQYAPELLDEMRGVAEEARVDYGSLLTFTLSAPFEEQNIPDCTVVAVTPDRTIDKVSIVGRNYDFFHDISDKGATTYCTYPKGRYASVGNCDIWVGRNDGLNEAGLFVGMAQYFFPGLKPGLIFWFILRLILDRCANVDEGLKLIQNVPHAQSFTYLMADRSGKALVVEPTVEGIELRYPEDGLLIMTNHAVCKRWVGRETFVPPDSHPRYNRLRELLGGQDLIDLETVKQAMRDHKGFICSHGEHMTDRKFGTIWSTVGKLNGRQVNVAEGHPCEVEYRTVNF